MKTAAACPSVRLRHIVAACALCLTVSAAIAEAQQAGGRILGAVQDLTGLPAAGASITARGPVERHVDAGEDGRFALEALPHGTYTITATLAGFAPSNRTIEIVDSGTAAIELTLVPQILEQVTVSADRTGERQLQKTSMAVTRLSEAELTRREAHTVADLAGLAPGVTVSQSTGFSQLAIRGIGSTVVFAGSEPSSAVYVDNVYIARPAAVLTDFIDLDRVEVLRGPQGTLYGHNVVGGALKLTTKLPADEAAFSARLTLGNLETARAEVNASGPVVRNRIMAGASVVRATGEGYVEDLNHPDNPLGGTDVAGARAVVRVLFSDTSELRVRGDYTTGDPTPLFYAKVLAFKPGFAADNPSDLHQVRTSEPARSHYVHKGASAQFIWRPTPSTVLTSLTAVRRFDYDLRIDTDSTELDQSISNTHEIHDQLSQELTLAGERRGIRWTGGVFAFNDVDRQPTLSELLFAGLDNTLDPRVEGRSTAAFAQATVGAGPRLGAVVGLRYSRDRKTLENAGTTVAGDRVLTSFQYRDSTSATAWTPKFGLDYQIDERTFAYLSATRGYKSGGFNISAPEARGGFAPEWAWTYEAGVKWSALNGRARLNGAVYFTDYTDLQVQTPVRPGVFDITNAATATIRGIELEAEIRTGPGWRLGGHAAWMDARYDRYTAVGPGGSSVDAAGRRLFNAPEYSGRTFLEYQRQLGAAGALSVWVEALMQSTVYFTPLNDPVQRQGAHGLVNANVTLRPRRRWSIGVFARNLTDTGYLTGTSSVPPPAIAGRPGEGRRFGLQLTLTN